MNRRAFLLGAAMVLLVNLVAVALRSFAEASFIAAYGKPALPWLLVLSAGGFAVATVAYDAITRRARTAIVDPTLLVLLLLAAAASPTLVHLAPPGVVVVALAATSQVAGLALWNRVAASVAGRDARRNLPLAGAAVTTGGVIAGLGAGVLIPRLGAPAIPYLAAGVTALVFVLCLVQARALATGGAPGMMVPPGTVETLSPPQRHLLRGLVVVALVEGVVTTVIDLQFLGTMRAHYAGDELAAMLAWFYGGTNLVLLLLQATAVPIILVTRSLPFTAAIHPVVVILGYAVFAIAPSLVTIAGTRTADQVLRLATSRTSQEIELSPFPPTPRARWKVLLRGALWPAGAAGAALVLLLVGPQAATTLAVAGIAVAIAWWIVGQIAARRFQTALAAPLGIKATRRDDPTIDLDTLERWSEAAGSDDPRIAALAGAALARARVDVADLGDHLTHEKAALRAALFDQLGNAPRPALRNELRAAIAIEDDDRALALGIKALAMLGDDHALDLAKGRAVLAPEVAAAIRTAELALRGAGDPAQELTALCGRDPRWAIALARKGVLPAAELERVLTTVAADPGRRAGALVVIAHVGTGGAFAALADALADGATDATTAIAALDADGATHIASLLAAIPPVGRAIMARSLAGAPTASALVVALLADPDAEVAHAALRTALAIASGGGRLPSAPIALALEDALRALGAHLDARDAAAAWSACARHELELATRRCVARLLWAAAVEAAAAGRDPAPLAATARVLVGNHEANRKRALDVVQELQAGRTEILAVIERWIRPALATGGSTRALATFDPWLARLGAGELADDEPTLALLRKPALLQTVSGPALAELATRARRERVTGTIFHEGELGDTMLVVARGAVIARRAAPIGGTVAVERRIEPGGVVGELAVLSHAPRAATVVADGDETEVLMIDRATFARAARRAPELVLGLAATLAGWIAPNRPDLL